MDKEECGNVIKTTITLLLLGFILLVTGMIEYNKYCSNEQVAVTVVDTSYEKYEEVDENRYVHYATIEYEYNGETYQYTETVNSKAEVGDTFYAFINRNNPNELLHASYKILMILGIMSIIVAIVLWFISPFKIEDVTNKRIIL